MRTVGVVTTSRADYGIYLPILRTIEASSELSLHLYVSGTHLDEAHSSTKRDNEADEFKIFRQVPASSTGDCPKNVAQAMGDVIREFGVAFSDSQPDIVLILGDRYEMHSAALATVPFGIPLAHIHGGELTLGAIDDVFRHSLTKMSHIHFPATEAYAQRIRQMGEEPWRIRVCGAPSLDNIASIDILSENRLADVLQWDGANDCILATLHPTTLEWQDTREQTGEFLAAMHELRCPIAFTAANADTCGDYINGAIRGFVAGHKNARLFANLGTRIYFSLMSHARVMVGNSSSGIIEAPSFALPVVNVGSRQDRRIRAANVIDVPFRTESILDGIEEAMSLEFRTSLADAPNPYGDGQAASRITRFLEKVELGPRLLRKDFVDLEFAGGNS